MTPATAPAVVSHASKPLCNRMRTGRHRALGPFAIIRETSTVRVIHAPFITGIGMSLRIPSMLGAFLFWILADPFPQQVRVLQSSTFQTVLNRMVILSSMLRTAIASRDGRFPATAANTIPSSIPSCNRGPDRRLVATSLTGRLVVQAGRTTLPAQPCLLSSFSSLCRFSCISLSAFLTSGPVLSWRSLSAIGTQPICYSSQAACRVRHFIFLRAVQNELR